MMIRNTNPPQPRVILPQLPREGNVLTMVHILFSYGDGGRNNRRSVGLWLAPPRPMRLWPAVAFLYDCFKYVFHQPLEEHRSPSPRGLAANKSSPSLMPRLTALPMIG